jgi:hypothetical protein
MNDYGMNRIEYRIATLADIPKIKELCDVYKIKYPEEGVVFLATEGENIVGVIAAVTRVVIEPFVCANPLASKTLFDMTMGALHAQNAKTVWLVPTEEKLIREGEKAGFISIIKDATILEKVL